MKKIALLAALLALIVAITGCGGNTEGLANVAVNTDSNTSNTKESNTSNSKGEEENSEDVIESEEANGTYQTIGPAEAKEMMDSMDDVLILDVRTLSEFNEAHIPGAVLSDVSTINTEAPNVIPEMDTTVLVYCRSGNRSATASAILADMGYTNVYDFGGIIDWPYDIITEE